MKQPNKPGPKLADPAEKKTRANISISPSTLKLLQEIAASEGISASQWISRAILAAALGR